MFKTSQTCSSLFLSSFLPLHSWPRAPHAKSIPYASGRWQEGRGHSRQIHQLCRPSQVPFHWSFHPHQDSAFPLCSPIPYPSAPHPDLYLLCPLVSKILICFYASHLSSPWGNAWQICWSHGCKQWFLLLSSPPVPPHTLALAHIAPKYW